MTYPQNERDLETPEGDAAEQAAVADPNWADDADEPAVSSSLEAPEWDAQEQGRSVPLDDDYR
ncbi:hypothetical protein [Actinoplanes auranticolor]|uniref:Uncharacterized protein n=1 Tax=Actinoplanes auranticolor TaxID=47988 RepID=A0A919VUF6_9ACTN|nr:hypothetical protein [Actinoplanes auranticolor]GIM76242.1 hypothetical protein Aau02nite_69930 [Actinoplanes auranticolor]